MLGSRGPRRRARSGGSWRARTPRSSARSSASWRNERDREILLRFYIAEEDKDRIAADYGLSSLQFNRVLHRARQRYKELLTGAARRRRAGRSVGGAIVLLLITLWRGALRRRGL